MKTIKEIIDYVNSVKPSQYTQAQMIEWLSEIDWQIYKEIILNHEHEIELAFNGYTTEDLDKELIAEEPYANLIYVAYLESKIDYNNEEYSKFNNAMVMFNNAYQNYHAYYKRTHKSTPDYRVKF